MRPKSFVINHFHYICLYYRHTHYGWGWGGREGRGVGIKMSWVEKNRLFGTRVYYVEYL